MNGKRASMKSNAQKERGHYCRSAKAGVNKFFKRLRSKRNRRSA